MHDLFYFGFLSTDALSAPQPESQQPVASQIPAPTRPRTPPAPEVLKVHLTYKSSSYIDCKNDIRAKKDRHLIFSVSQVLAPASTQAVGARSWAPASVTHGTPGDGAPSILYLYYNDFQKCFLTH